MKKLVLFTLIFFACNKDDEADPSVFSPVGKIFIYTEIRIDDSNWEPDEDPSVLYFINPSVFYEGFLTGATGSQGKQEVQWFDPQAYELSDNVLKVFLNDGTLLAEVSVSFLEAGLWLFEFEAEGPDGTLVLYGIKVEERSNTEFTLP